MPFTHPDHALQASSVLRAQCPDDLELAVAGLVHDSGHLLGDAEHAEAGAMAVRAVLGERVAWLAGLHVAAKLYLVARQVTYGGTFAADWRRFAGACAPWWAHVSGRRAGRVRGDAQRQDALLLRRADESRKVDGLEVVGLGDWMPIVRRASVSGRVATSR
jgi:predicted HD phosphohydrolase